MNVRCLLSLVLCGALVVVMGCPPAPPTTEPEEDQPPAEMPVEPEAPAKPAPKPAEGEEAEAPSSGKCVKAKLAAMTEAAEAKDLAKIQAAAKDVCAALGKHKTKSAETAAKEDYKAKEAAAVAAVKAVAASTTADAAVAAADKAKATCMGCHMVYKKK